MKTLIRQARILNPATQEDKKADLLIDGETISRIESSISDSSAKTIDADGWWLIPGLVDIHVHLREPGAEKKETIATGTLAAAAGGVTSVVCMANTSPPIDNNTEIEFILERVKRTGYVRVYPVGTVTKALEGKEIANIGSMVDAGAIAISDDGRNVTDPLVMRRAMEYSTIFGIPIITHNEEHILTDGGTLNEGKMSMMMGLQGCPAEAESISIARDLILAKKTGAHVHIAHLSAAESVDLLRFYKRKGVQATGETAPHYLLLTDDAVDGYNTNAKMNPPLRTKEDQNALYEGLKDGTIDSIATDHAPHTIADKNQEFPLAPFGIIGLETLLPLLLGRIRERAGLDLLSLLGLVTHKPAAVMNLPGGKIEVGGPADITLWNPDPTYSINADHFYSKARNTPFHGWEVKGRVEATFVAGRQVFSYGKTERI
ncbi:MAG: dihydroorotase [Candidatus Omnitrophota bacterium]|jgi:dihydroorotase|nr:MAG: dihydroorotase [Candidatus Omnitrophota bacterium]